MKYSEKRNKLDLVKKFLNELIMNVGSQEYNDVYAPRLLALSDCLSVVGSGKAEQERVDKVFKSIDKTFKKYKGKYRVEIENNIHTINARQ